MKNHKTKNNYKFVLLIALAFGAAMAILLSFWNHPSEKKLPITPISATPTPVPFQIISIFPGSGPQTIVIKNTAIAVTFSGEILPNSISVSTTPYVSLQTELKPTNPSVVYLKPISKWQYQQKYSIRISAASTNGQIVENYQFDFQPIPPRGNYNIPPGGI